MAVRLSSMPSPPPRGTEITKAHADHFMRQFTARNLLEGAEKEARRGYLSNLPQRSPEWFAERIGFLSGSNMNAIQGGDRFKTRGEVFDGVFGVAKKTPINADMRRGIDHEDDAVEAHRKLIGMEITETGLHQHPDPKYYMVASSPDGLIGDDGVLEIKCPRPGPYALVPHCPPWHYAQVQAHMQCSGRAWCDYVKWVDGETAAVRVTRDDRYWDEILGPALLSFWYDHVVTGIRPLD